MAFENAARDEVAKDMGADKFVLKENMTAPDGSFKPALRKTVLDALLETRFDSVSTVMSDQRWTKANADPFKKPSQPDGGSMSGVDRFRKPMVAQMKFGKKDMSSTIQVDPKGNKELEQQDLTIADMKHPGFNIKDGGEGEEEQGATVL